MHSKTIRAATAFLLVLTWRSALAAPAADEGLALPAACANVTARGLHAAGHPAPGFEAASFKVRLPTHDAAGATAPSMEAARLAVEAQAAATSNAALERAASAAAAALLISLTGSGHSDCDTGLLRDAGKPIVQGLQQGGAYLATWQRVTLRGKAGHVTASRMQLRLQAAPGGSGDRPVHVTLTLDGIAGSLTPPTLLPNRIALRVTLPASSLPTLLAATGGGAPDAQIPVTVDDFSITSGQTQLQGQGDATAAATPMDSSATLHVTARNYDDLVEAAATRDLTRLHTMLFLSRLMGRRVDNALEWDLKFSSGLLAVNDVPIPLR